MRGIQRIGASFRDPSGFVFIADGVLYRQVNPGYQANYDQLMQGGLYDDLRRRQLLIAHEEVDQPGLDGDACKLLQPERVPFISYPYEWCFSQLKDAALATLRIQKRALAHGMTLKDASAYNIQFLRGQPTLIDTLSFELYQAGDAWQAYRQFCQHFLAPLALMSYGDVRLSQLLRAHIDGIPLDLAAALLPKRAWLRLGLAMHILLHARAQKRHAGGAAGPSKRGKRLSQRDLLNIADSLRSIVEGLRWDHGGTFWAGYYAGDSYQAAGMAHKRQLVAEFIQRAAPGQVWDLGANTGLFSRIASQQGLLTVSMDNDPGVVEANYLQAKADGEEALHPLLIDLTNPSPSLGWANQERDSLAARGPADCLLALALLHHLAISNNVPFARIAAFFASLAPWLIIEFVPKSDPKVQALLSARPDIFADYHQSAFEREFGQVYEVAGKAGIEQSERALYLMRRRA